VLAVIAISMAFPFGLGLLAIVWAIAMAGAVIGTGIICFKIAKELIGGTASFNYSPNMAYLTGKKGGKEKGQEKTDKAQMENDKEQ
jgi:small neutral amino acid transporter SnatA (MarC family)